MADAHAQGADCVVTLGGLQSNHARATAVAARYLGLDAHLILRTSRVLLDKDPGLVGNLLVERMVGVGPGQLGGFMPRPCRTRPLEPALLVVIVFQAQVHLVSKEQYALVGQQALGAALVDKLREQGRRSVRPLRQPRASLSDASRHQCEGTPFPPRCRAAPT